MNRKTIFMFLGLLVVFITLLAMSPSIQKIYLKYFNQPFNLSSVPPSVFPSPLPSTAADEVVFQGTITGVNQGCFVDAICSYKVDDYNVIVVEGMVSNPNPQVGKVIGVELDEKYIGTKVEVYAKTISESELTIFGKDEYYIKALN